jgi:hypothetical protein
MARYGSLGRIDDPFDAAKKAYQKNDENLASKVALHVGKEVALCIGVVNPIAGLIVAGVDGARDYFPKKSSASV